MSGWTEANLYAGGGMMGLTGEFTPSPVPRRDRGRLRREGEVDEGGADESASAAAAARDPWEASYFNGGAILQEIPVRGRADNVEQVAFRPQDGGEGQPKVRIITQK